MLGLKVDPQGEVAVRGAVRALKPIAQAKDVAFILNDRPDLAAELDCDGVHVGQDDGPYDEARKTVGPNKVVGITCHNSRHLALEAAEAGADYVAFGAFFATTTKQAKATANIEIVQWWAEIMEIPCVAIGGITTQNAAPLIEAGADFLAVAGGVWDHPQGAAAAVQEFNQAFSRTKR